MHMKRTRFDCKAFVTVLLSVVLMAFVISHTAYAASSATFGVTVPSTSVGIGDTVEITVQLSPGKENISDYSYTINYDPALLEAVNGGTVEDEGSISYSGSSGSEESMTATFCSCQRNCQHRDPCSRGDINIWRINRHDTGLQLHQHQRCSEYIQPG